MEERSRHTRAVRRLAVASLVLVGLANVPSAHAGGFKTEDEIWARFAREHPTFGGMFRAGKRVKIWLTDDGETLDAVFAALVDRAPRLKKYEPVALPGRWNFAELYDWYYPLSTRVLGMRGGVFTDIDEGINRIVFGVDDRPRLIDRVNAMIARHGVPRAAVKVVEGQAAQQD